MTQTLEKETKSNEQTDWQGYIPSIDKIICPCNPEDPVEIRSENVIQHHDYRLGLRIVRAHCHACGRCLKFSRRMSDGGWSNVQVELLEGDAKKGFLARLDHLRNVSQIKNEK